MKKIVFLIFALTVLLQACYKDNEEELYKYEDLGKDNCITENMSFVNDVEPIIKSQCGGCHNASAQQGNINLDGYENVKKQAESGKLFGSISHEAGFSPMPKGGGKLPKCSVDKIKAWIDQGIKNN